MELFGVAISADILKLIGGGVTAALVAWRGRRVKKAVDALVELASLVSMSRAETSPEGKRFSQEEMEHIVDSASKALKSLSPLLTRFFAKK